MAEISPSLLIHNRNLDPKYLIPENPKFIMERGPRFKEYSDLRERNLRLKNPIPDTEEKLQIRSVLTPQRKQVKFSSDFITPSAKSKTPSSALAQSVPDFSSALRKENRRPAENRKPAEKVLTPPAGMSKSGRMYGSKSADKSSCGLMARKSYANMAELKKSGVAAGKKINGRKTGRGSKAAAVFGNMEF